MNSTNGRDDWLEAPIATLDLQKVGDVLLRFPLVALQLGHGSLNKTTTYFHPTTPEARFVVDLLDVATSQQGSRPLDAFVEHWFGGEAGAMGREYEDLGYRLVRVDEATVERMAEAMHGSQRRKGEYVLRHLKRAPSAWFEWPRSGTHSRKPEASDCTFARRDAAKVWRHVHTAHGKDDLPPADFDPGPWL